MRQLRNTKKREEGRIGRRGYNKKEDTKGLKGDK
jgi:hypothetical protein